VAVQLHSPESGNRQKDCQYDFMEAQAERQKLFFRRKAENERCGSCGLHHDCSMYDCSKLASRSTTVQLVIACNCLHGDDVHTD
jgi:hypothetical protein